MSILTSTPAVTNANVLSNEKAYEADRRKVFNAATSLGKEGGTGARSLVKLASVAVRGAYDGVLSIHKPAPGASGTVPKDDATRLYDAYVSGYSQKNEHGSVSQQACKLRAFIKVGARRDIDAVDEFNRWERMWKDARDSESAAKKKSTLPEYHALAACATTQIAEGQNGPLTDNQIEDCIRKSAGKSKDFEALIKSAYKLIEKAVAIRPDESAEEAARQLNNALAFLAADEENAKAAEARAAEYDTFLALQAKFGFAQAAE